MPLDQATRDSLIAQNPGMENQFAYDDAQKKKPAPLNQQQQQMADRAKAQEATLAETPDVYKNTLSESNKLPWQQYLDTSLANNLDATGKNHNGLANQIWNRAQNGENEGLLSHGVPTQASAIQLGNQPQGYNNPMNDAIAGKYNEKLTDTIRNQKQLQDMGAPMRQSEELARSSDIFGKQQAIQMQNFKEQYAFQQQRQQLFTQYVNAQNQAEGEVLGQILGSLPFVGGIFGGLAKGSAENVV